MFLKPERTPQIQNRCRGCGKAIGKEHNQCCACAIPDATQRLIHAARKGRLAGHPPAARAKEGRKQRDRVTARSFNSAIALAIGVSRWYAGRIRHGCRPHPQHWRALARLVGVSVQLDETKNQTA